MSALLWQPPQVSGIKHQDALWNAILTHARHPLPLSGDVYAAFDPADEPDEKALCTHIKAGGFPNAPELFIVWRHFPFTAMLQASLSVDDLPAIPQVLRDALVEGMINLVAQSALQDVLENGVPELRIIATNPLNKLKKKIPADVAWFDVNIENMAPEPIALRIGCARSQVIAMAASRDLSALPIQKAAKTSISIPGIYTLGSATFFPQQLKSLQEGAVIVLPSLPEKQQLLRLDKTVWEFHANGNDWILAGQRKRIQEARQPRRKDQHVTDQEQEQEGNPQNKPHDEKVAAEASASETPGDVLLQTVQELISSDIVEHNDEDDLVLGDEDMDHVVSDADEPDQLAADAAVEDTMMGEPPTDEAEPLPVSDTPKDINWVEDQLVEEGIRLADLGITVDFDIGERDFTLAELETWQPGAVVALDPPAIQGHVEVTLRANGRTIATGDLIAIDDRLAIRLSKLMLRS